MRYPRLFVTVCAGLLMIFSGCGDGNMKDALVSTAQPDPFSKNALIRRSINLGNYLESPRDASWGVEIVEEDFPRIRNAGFDGIRIPVRWSAWAADNAPYTIEPEFFGKVDWTVDNALDAGLHVVLNMHHYEEIFENPEEHHDRFLRLWEQIAAHYAGHPQVLYFEFLNEPNGELGVDEWNRLVNDVIPLVRQSNPRRTFVIGPASWNNIAYLDSLRLPENDRNIIVTYHYYSPFRFTHQGAGWAGDEADDWLGTTWEGTPRQMNDVRTDFNRAASWAERHDRPIFMGEFGAYQTADMASRAAWTSFVAREAEARGFSWAYWEYCAGFGAYDRDAGTWREPLLNALIPED